MNILYFVIDYNERGGVFIQADGFVSLFVILKIVVKEKLI